MSEIEIPMNSWSTNRLASKMKHATSRNKKYGKIGDVFSISIAGLTNHYELLDYAHLPLWYIARFLFALEGAVSEKEFLKVWKEIHPSFDYEKDKYNLVWIHFFKEISGPSIAVKKEQVMIAVASA